MIRSRFIGTQPLAVEASQRNEAIALAERMNAAIEKAGERRLPEDERRQVLPVVTDQDGTTLIGFVPSKRYLPDHCCADAISTGGAIANASPRTWEQRTVALVVLLTGLPIVIGAAWIAHRTILVLATWAGALFA